MESARVLSLDPTHGLVAAEVLEENVRGRGLEDEGRGRGQTLLSFRARRGSGGEAANETAQHRLVASKGGGRRRDGTRRGVGRTSSEHMVADVRGAGPRG